MRTILAGLTVLGLALPAAAADDAKEAAGVVRSVVDKVLVLLQDKKLARGPKRDRVLETVEPLLDLKLMAKLSLGRGHWAKLDEAQRKTFTDLFVEQLKASYFEKIDLYTDETVEFEDPRRVEDKVQVPTRIVTKDQPVRMLYKCYKAPAGWKVYDIDIEGVSIVKSYGSQYDAVLRDAGVEDLLTQMRRKVEKEWKEKPPEAGKSASGGS